MVRGQADIVQNRLSWLCKYNKLNKIEALLTKQLERIH